MDRYDEKKDHTDEVPDSPRKGDVLGLGGSPVPKEPGDPTAEHDPESAAKRRARAREEESRSTPREPSETEGGAASIDMGAGGEGNLVRRRE